MQVGKLDKRITWQYPAKTSDGMLGETVTWTTVCETWARILPKSAKEIRQSEQMTMNVTHTVRIRYRNPFLPSWRGLFRGRIFQIIGIVNPEEKNEWLDILVRETNV